MLMLNIAMAKRRFDFRRGLFLFLLLHCERKGESKRVTSQKIDKVGELSVVALVPRTINLKAKGGAVYSR